ncbi:CDGSH iron-sulfur domain-containing protein [Streptomyces cacaoi]|uniref:CDGSH iron-sulfur domain-containing protein n=1 Tax=Streptomyces cacaoi TaxID=1898 RepID=UPI0037021CD8
MTSPPGDGTAPETGAGAGADARAGAGADARAGAGADARTEPRAEAGPDAVADADAEAEEGAGGGAEGGRDPRRVLVDPAGPVLVEGPVEVELPDGSTACSDRFMVALCTCRRSRTQPWCDSSHRRRTPPGRGSPGSGPHSG